MHDPNIKHRWVFSSLESIEGHERPVAAEYAVGTWIAPLHHEGFALVLVSFNAHTLAAARQDPRLTVLESIHSKSPVPKHVTDHHAQHGAKEGMVLHELLIAMAQHHHYFEPEF